MLFVKLNYAKKFRAELRILSWIFVENSLRRDNDIVGAEQNKFNLFHSLDFL